MSLEGRGGAAIEHASATGQFNGGPFLPDALPTDDVGDPLGAPPTDKEKGGGNGGGGGGKGGGGGGGDTGTAPTDIALSNDTVDENSAAGTVIGSFSATDADKRERFSYRLLDDAGVFAINGKDTLVLADGASLDFETVESYDITVEVTDKQGNTYTETMTIWVNDLDEAPNLAPTDLTLSGLQVAEDAGNGTEVGRLTATDPDPNESFTYVLLDDAGGRFSISGDRIVVADASRIDFETQTSHVVEVQVTDSAGNTYTESFTIGVTDVDESVSTALADQPDYVQALILPVNGEVYYVWPDDTPADSTTVITFTFLSAFPQGYSDTTMPYTGYASGAPVDFVPLTAAQVTAIYQLIAELEELIDIDFVEVGAYADAQVSFGQYLQDSGIGAYAYYPSALGSEGTRSGDVWLNSRYDTSPSTSEDGMADWARSAIAHEIGHAIGLKHPGDYNAGGGGTDGPYLDPAVDSGQYTVMSYQDYAHSGYDPVDYQLYDIAALQYLYGANDTTRAGDTVYSFTTHARLVDTIWDAGGFDTMDASAVTSDVVIDLNQGAFSTIGLSERKDGSGNNLAMTDNIAIAYGAEIEAAIGGSGNDRLVGNALDNTLDGRAGNDTFVFDLDWGDDLVMGFVDGADLLDLSGTGLGFGDLSLSAGVSGAEIIHGDNRITLDGFDVALVDEADFVFAIA